jgi:hypothetical protein
LIQFDVLEEGGRYGVAEVVRIHRAAHWGGDAPEGFDLLFLVCVGHLQKEGGVKFLLRFSRVPSFLDMSEGEIRLQAV